MSAASGAAAGGTGGSIIYQWLDRIGLGYAIPMFQALGINNPTSLMKLTFEDYDAVGVTEYNDRKRLFELVHRVREAAKKGSAAGGGGGGSGGSSGGSGGSATGSSGSGGAAAASGGGGASAAADADEAARRGSSTPGERAGLNSSGGSAGRRTSGSPLRPTSPIVSPHGGGPSFSAAAAQLGSGSGGGDGDGSDSGADVVIPADLRERLAALFRKANFSAELTTKFVDRLMARDPREIRGFLENPQKMLNYFNSMLDRSGSGGRPGSSGSGGGGGSTAPGGGAGALGGVVRVDVDSASGEPRDFEAVDAAGFATPIEGSSAGPRAAGRAVSGNGGGQGVVVRRGGALRDRDRDRSRYGGGDAGGEDDGYGDRGRERDAGADGGEGWWEREDRDRGRDRDRDRDRDRGRRERERDAKREWELKQAHDGSGAGAEGKSSRDGPASRRPSGAPTEAVRSEFDRRDGWGGGGRAAGGRRAVGAAGGGGGGGGGGAGVGPEEDEPQIMVVVRARPLNKAERNRKESSVLAPISRQTIEVHEPKTKVDLTRYTETHHFTFDEVFGADTTTERIYDRTAKPLVSSVFEGVNATCFAYGQTGSGKTHTMMGGGTARHPGIYQLAARDIFERLDDLKAAGAGGKLANLGVYVSFYEIYGGRLFDLLNDRKALRALVDQQQAVQIVGLGEQRVEGMDALFSLIDYGLAARSTGSTGANMDSSRSHAVLQIALKRKGSKKPYGKFSFIDLAGSERGADTTHNDRQTRLEGAEINKSLLALKECIRSLYQEAEHTPFRGSKLTQVLKDSFTGSARTVMIATVSPSDKNCEHTLNTLRYAYRVKEIRREEDEDPVEGMGGVGGAAGEGGAGGGADAGSLPAGVTMRPGSRGGRVGGGAGAAPGGAGRGGGGGGGGAASAYSDVYSSDEEGGDGGSGSAASRDADGPTAGRRPSKVRGAAGGAKGSAPPKAKGKGARSGLPRSGARGGGARRGGGGGAGVRRQSSGGTTGTDEGDEEDELSDVATAGMGDTRTRAPVADVLPPGAAAGAGGRAARPATAPGREDASGSSGATPWTNAAVAAVRGGARRADTGDGRRGRGSGSDAIDDSSADEAVRVAPTDVNGGRHGGHGHGHESKKDREEGDLGASDDGLEPEAEEGGGRRRLRSRGKRRGGDADAEVKSSPSAVAAKVADDGGGDVVTALGADDDADDARSGDANEDDSGRRRKAGRGRGKGKGGARGGSRANGAAGASVADDLAVEDVDDELSASEAGGGAGAASAGAAAAAAGGDGSTSGGPGADGPSGSAAAGRRDGASPASGLSSEADAELVALHRSQLQAMMDITKSEMRLVALRDRADVSTAEYVRKVDELLGRKLSLILDLRAKVAAYQTASQAGGSRSHRSGATTPADDADIVGDDGGLGDGDSLGR